MENKMGRKTNKRSCEIKLLDEEWAILPRLFNEIINYIPASVVEKLIV